MGMCVIGETNLGATWRTYGRYGPSSNGPNSFVTSSFFPDFGITEEKEATKW